VIFWVKFELFIKVTKNSIVNKMDNFQQILMKSTLIRIKPQTSLVKISAKFGSVVQEILSISQGTDMKNHPVLSQLVTIQHFSLMPKISEICRTK